MQPKSRDSVQSVSAMLDDFDCSKEVRAEEEEEAGVGVGGWVGGSGDCCWQLILHRTSHSLTLPPPCLPQLHYAVKRGAALQRGLCRGAPL